MSPHAVCYGLQIDSFLRAASDMIPGMSHALILLAFGVAGILQFAPNA